MALGVEPIRTRGGEGEPRARGAPIPAGRSVDRTPPHNDETNIEVR